MRGLGLVLLGIMSFWAMPVWAELSAQAIAVNCMICHTSTATAASLPRLEAFSRLQLQQTLLDFKYAKKPSTLMGRLVKGYSDSELAAVAEYLGHL